MSRKYKDGDVVPAAVIANRLKDLSKCVTQGRDAIDREFVMRIPAERDRCPDLVLSEAAMRLIADEKLKAAIRAEAESMDFSSPEIAKCNILDLLGGDS